MDVNPTNRSRTENFNHEVKEAKKRGKVTLALPNLRLKEASSLKGRVKHVKSNSRSKTDLVGRSMALTHGLRKRVTKGGKDLPSARKAISKKQSSHKKLHEGKTLPKTARASEIEREYFAA